MSLFRSAAAVLAGCAVIVAILRLFVPGASFLPGLLWTVFGAMLGGYITAFVAGSRELPHAAGIGLVLIAMSFFSMRRSEIFHPGWYETSVAGCGPLAALTGAALRMLTKRQPSS